MSDGELIPRASSSPKVTLDSRVQCAVILKLPCKSNSCENATVYSCKISYFPMALFGYDRVQRRPLRVFKSNPFVQLLVKFFMVNSSTNFNCAFDGISSEI